MPTTNIHLTRAEACARSATGKPVYASYWDGEQINVRVTNIIDRGYGNYAVCSAEKGVSLAMPYDRIAFSTRPL